MNSNLAFRQKGHSVYHHLLNLLFILHPQKTPYIDSNVFHDRYTTSNPSLLIQASRLLSDKTSNLVLTYDLI
jgi:hypothetical protein